MDSPDLSPERLERVKRVLADSYPEVSDGERETLPASVLEALGEPPPASVPSGRAKGGVLSRLQAILRGPQLVGIGAAAVLVVVAVVLLKPDGGGGGGGSGTGGGVIMRGSPGTASGPPLIVFRGLSEAQEEALRASEFFRPEQLLRLEASEDLASFLERQRAEQVLRLVLVDGASGQLSAPLVEGAPEPRTFEAGEPDLSSSILTLLAEIPEASEGETEGRP